MAARPKGHGVKYDWEPVQNNGNNSIYGSQFGDEDDNDNVQYDHTRLYITNIPKALNEDGLKAAFSKFGCVKLTFVSRDPQRKFGIIKYETASEAKLAMMKMNRTEPLKLNVAIALKPGVKNKKENQINEDSLYDNRDDTASIINRVRSVRKEDLTNGGFLVEDKAPLQEISFTDPMDPSLDLELESLKLEQLKLREEQLLCKHRMLLLKQAGSRSLQQQSLSGNRSILPDGRIIVQNVNDRQMDSRDADANFVAGSGDSRVASRSCVQCGASADAFCARCGVTPYCSERCQRRDWSERHRAVCHNLARLAALEGVKKDEEEIGATNAPSAMVYRTKSPSRSTKWEIPAPRRENIDSDKGKKIFTPPDHKAVFKSAPSYKPNSKVARNHAERLQEMRRPKAYLNKDEEEVWGLSDKTPPQQQTKESPQRKLNTSSQTTALTTNSQPRKTAPTDQQDMKVIPMAKRETLKEATNGLSTATEELEEAAECLPMTKKMPALEANVQIPMKEPDVLKEETNVSNKVAVQNQSVRVEVPTTELLLPKTYLIEQLAIGEVALLSVDNKASECRGKGPGHVCLSMHERYEADYQRLCEDYGADCEADGTDYRPNPGEAFSYLNPDDGGWYRARALTSTLAALLDSSRIVTVTTAGAKCKKLPPKYAEIPEFCCLLDSKNVTVGCSVKCTLVSKMADAFEVSLEDVESGVSLGEGVISRWIPEVEYPVVNKTVPTNVAETESAAGLRPTETDIAVPEVPRPSVYDSSRVLLVDATAPDRLVVRPADAHSQQLFDGVLQDVLLYGTAASPLKEPPVQGQVVIAKFTDGLHYRALCKRTNVKKDKYQLEYIEYGNIEVSKLELLYPCPSRLDLTSVPTLASVVSLGLAATTLTPSAEQYLEALKDEEMLLNLPGRAKTATSGSVACLTVVKNNEVVNKKVEKLCTPEWKILEERGGDVLETKKLMFIDLEYMEMPVSGCTVDVLDDALLPHGTLYGRQAGLTNTDQTMTKLVQRMTEYCNSALGREPYLPNFEELCIAKNLETGEWARAVMLEQPEGPGGDRASVLYVDLGSFQQVPVSSLRKMLPEFLHGLPAFANTLEIRDFPTEMTAEMVERARRFMGKSALGHGQLRLVRCHMQDPGLYTVDAPELLQAILSP